MKRREFVAGSGVALAGAVTGCSGVSSSETQATDPYSVSMAPVGAVTFESVPETWVANNGSWADMGIALGLDAPEGLWLPSRYHTNYYDDIPGVSVDTDPITQLSDDGVDKEQFYELDGDVHVIDPNFLQNRFDSWEQEDIDEVSENIAPFFGNTIFSRDYAWHESYQYYTLEEGFEKLAAVFQREDRYEAMMTERESFLEELDSVVPDTQSERPNVAVLWGGDQPEQFYPYTIGEGTSFRQLRDLGVSDALGSSDVQDFHETRGQIDYETLLEVDPGVILVRGHENKSRSEFEDAVVSFMTEHDSASSLTAVQNGDVYRGGPLYQGPITNMVVAERQASQFYDVDGELFDRERVGDVVAGDL